MAKIKILLIDDHSIVRQGLMHYFATDERLDVVASISSIEDFYQLKGDVLPNVALVDLQLSGSSNGIDVTKQLKQRWPHCEVVILTSYHQDDLILAAFEAGALGYLLKDIEPDELVQAVEKAANKQAVFSPLIANKLLSLTSFNGESRFSLSDRELQILKLIAEGYNNTEIAELCFIHIKTVRSHVSNILAKLQLRDRTQLAIHAWRSGLVGQQI